MSLFGAVTGEEMRMARIVTGAAMAAFIGVGFAPGLREHARAITVGAAGAVSADLLWFVAYVLIR